MNKIVICIAVLIFGFFSAASAQNCQNQYWGTKTIYEPQQKKYVPVPKGYKPVFINYVGRHGARHLTKDVFSYPAYAVLQKADSAKALKSDGYKLKQMIVRLQEIERQGLKAISTRGAAEQQGIGARMLLHYPEVFKIPYCVNVTLTKEERTKQSSEAFLKGLKYDPNSTCAEPKVNNDDLRFFAIAPAYADFEEKGNWKPQIEKLEKAVKPAGFNAHFLGRFFEKSFTDKMSADEQNQLIDDIFGFSSITNSIQAEIASHDYKKSDLDFRSLITCDELRVLDMLNSADDYLKKGPGTDINGIQVRDAVPLLVSFINTTDSYIAHKNLAAELRFAHAETIAPIAALMGLSGATTVASDITQFEKVWQASKVIPLSSNIQWVLFKSNKGKYLVKCLLNEKEVGIAGLPTKIFPYYAWDSVRAYYLNKLNKLHVNLNDDMHAYLMSVK